jgi:hypothetical protein
MWHGVPGALALMLGVFQFSTRLRQRFLKPHLILGRVYGAITPNANHITCLN